MAWAALIVFTVMAGPPQSIGRSKPRDQASAAGMLHSVLVEDGSMSLPRKTLPHPRTPSHEYRKPFFEPELRTSMRFVRRASALR